MGSIPVSAAVVDLSMDCPVRLDGGSGVRFRRHGSAGFPVRPYLQLSHHSPTQTTRAEIDICLQQEFIDGN
jgi:hypothetical protein